MSGDRACAHEGAPSADECARSTRQPEPRLTELGKDFFFLCSGQSHRKTPKIDVVISVRMRRAAKRHSFHNCNGPQLILGRGYHMFGWTRNTIRQGLSQGNSKPGNTEAPDSAPVFRAYFRAVIARTASTSRCMAARSSSTPENVSIPLT